MTLLLKYSCLQCKIGGFNLYHLIICLPLNCSQLTFQKCLIGCLSGQSFLPISADCLMSEWTPWCTGCSATCGTGTEQRSRRRLVLPWSSRNKITCGHKTIACMTGYPDCSFGSICSDGSLILHIEGNGFECDDSNHVQLETCNLPACGKQCNIK